LSPFILQRWEIKCFTGAVVFVVTMDDDTQELKGISDRAAAAGIAIRWAIAQVSSLNADKRRG